MKWIIENWAPSSVRRTHPLIRIFCFSAGWFSFSVNETTQTVVRFAFRQKRIPIRFLVPMFNSNLDNTIGNNLHISLLKLTHYIRCTTRLHKRWTIYLCVYNFFSTFSAMFRSTARVRTRVGFPFCIINYLWKVPFVLFNKSFSGVLWLMHELAPKTFWLIVDEYSGVRATTHPHALAIFSFSSFRPLFCPQTYLYSYIN